MNEKTSLADAKERRHVRKLIVMSFGIIAMLLLCLIPLASTYPDGLERIAEDLGFTGSGSLWSGFLPDYSAPVGGSWLATFLAGIIGVVVVLAAIFVIGRIMILRRTK